MDVARDANANNAKIIKDRRRKRLEGAGRATHDRDARRKLSASGAPESLVAETESRPDVGSSRKRSL